MLCLTLQTVAFPQPNVPVAVEVHPALLIQMGSPHVSGAFAFSLHISICVGVGNGVFV